MKKLVMAVTVAAMMTIGVLSVSAASRSSCARIVLSLIAFPLLHKKAPSQGRSLSGRRWITS